ncbi:MAG: tRNA epoxyqueuosine(34) reductase QueG [Acidobacteria bacterium]|nr:tRNA epoxyqueuosine(34) reductase QueG [Acidobacteriota bacterium]
MSTTLQDILTVEAAAVGLTEFGISPPVIDPAAVCALDRWRAAGFFGGMEWMADTGRRRTEPFSLYPAGRSIIVFVVPYFWPDAPTPNLRISRYARSRDYHHLVTAKLERLLQRLRAQVPNLDGRIAVDTAPLLERPLAVQAGLGWLGKNSCFIHPRFGSWIFLGELMINQKLPFSEPGGESHCGDCTLCLEACPTGALVAPGVLDARRCLSYLTIEHRGIIPPAFKGHLDGALFGCDRCQEVCPFNHRAAATPLPDFRPLKEITELTADHLAAMSGHAFRRALGQTPLARTRLAGLLRNLVALQAEEGAAILSPTTLKKILNRSELARRQHEAFLASPTPQTRD